MRCRLGSMQWWLRLPEHQAPVITDVTQHKHQLPLLIREYMLFQEINRLCSFGLGVMLLISFGNSLSGAERQTGTVVGSVSFVDESAREFLGDAANVTIELEYRRQTRIIVSDKQGDYIVELPRGEYC